MNDGKNEHDIIEHKATMGPGVKMFLYFVSSITYIVIGYCLCYYGVRVDIAEANLSIYIADTKEKAEIDADHLINQTKTKERLDATPYTSDCANMSIGIMRK